MNLVTEGHSGCAESLGLAQYRAFWRTGVFSKIAVLLLLGTLAGCGMPAPPLAPTLKLPDPAKDLTAGRDGSTVRLTWTMPRHSTDNLPLAGKVPIYVWRTQSGRSRELVGDFALEPGAAGAFADVLPPELQSGPFLPLVYTVELLNRMGHSAGLSTAAYSAAGAAPSAVQSLTAQLASDGVQLHWDVMATADGVLRIHRKLLDEKAASKATSPGNEKIGNEKKAASVTMLVAPTDGKDHGMALDASAVFPGRYQYWVERIERVKMEGHSVEVASLPSTTIEVLTRDVFPPTAPRQLVAVATQGGVDLSWDANTEPDLANYIVYRSETGAPTVRVSPQDPPLVAPTFRDTTTVPGHSYRYSVSAVDLSGNEGPRSAVAEETVPK